MPPLAYLQSRNQYAPESGTGNIPHAVGLVKALASLTAISRSAGVLARSNIRKPVRSENQTTMTCQGLLRARTPALRGGYLRCGYLDITGVLSHVPGRCHQILPLLRVVSWPAKQGSLLNGLLRCLRA